MRPPKRNKRLFSLIFIAASLSAGTFLIFSALGQNVSYFFTPIQIENGEADTQKRIRLGGLVAEGSVVRGAGTETTFRVTDGAAAVTVRYAGILPDLFREGQGVIAQGEFGKDRIFNAGTILAKHDENYKPKELVEGLKAAEGQKVSSNHRTKSGYKNSPNNKIQAAAYNTVTPLRGGHVSKTFISQNCSSMTLEMDVPVTGAAFITYTDNPNATFLAFSHGKNGASLYDTSGQRLWHIPQKADVLSSYGNILLIYRKEGEVSVLERMKVGLDGQVALTQVESPSAIAPSTLQRSSIASLGPVLFKDNGILFEKSFVKLKTPPTAIAGTTSAFGSSLKNGVVVIGLKNGDVQIWDKQSISDGCS